MLCNYITFQKKKKKIAKVFLKIVAKLVSARENTFAREKIIKEDALAYVVSINYINNKGTSGYTHVFQLCI